jgi:hypothetical protein
VQAAKLSAVLGTLIGAMQDASKAFKESEFEVVKKDITIKGKSDSESSSDGESEQSLDDKLVEVSPKKSEIQPYSPKVIKREAKKIELTDLSTN